MTVSEVRKRYLAFFAERGHEIIPSARIRPENDPTTLFTSSGMQPLVPYLLGQPHALGRRLTNSQKSVRTGDIDEIGDNRHLTFFEMLGNWSLGDYFKQEQLPWIFEFLTNSEKGISLDPKRLYVTVFSGDQNLGIPKDTEAIEIWKQLFAGKGIVASDIMLGTEEAGYENGMQDARIFGYNAKNWWSRAGTPDKMPVGEPGGPDSEIFYDFGTPHDSKWGKHCHPNCDCGRFVEICNSVFMEFMKVSDGSFEKLSQQNVDFGGGLERLAATTIGFDDIYRADTLYRVITELEHRAAYLYTDEEYQRSFRIVADHVRAAVFIAGDQVFPSNTDAGYILRRLVRRAIRHLDHLNALPNTLAELTAVVIQDYGDTYSELVENRDTILRVLTEEEERFRKTLSQGLREFEKLSTKGEISTDDAFLLFSTYGFPIEIIEELAQERDMKLNREEIKGKFEKHQATSRAGAAQKFAGGLADHAEQTVRYHTTHHILLKALQTVLGDEVKQRGSNITSERLRIDFSSSGKMTDEQKVEVERIVNETIYQDLPVTRTVMPREEAEKLGAQMEFGVKYPDMVSVYSVGPIYATEETPDIPNAYSLEFCGGPHVTNTSEIHAGGKKFKIQKEEAVAAGIRRIKAVLM
jgi:alanyl-tRNA synthetase